MVLLFFLVDRWYCFITSLLKSIVDVDSSCGSGELGADGGCRDSVPRTPAPSGAAGENRMRGVRVEFGVAERLITSLESVPP